MDTMRQSPWIAQLFQEGKLGSVVFVIHRWVLRRNQWSQTSQYFLQRHKLGSVLSKVSHSSTGGTKVLPPPQASVIPPKLRQGPEATLSWTELAFQKLHSLFSFPMYIA